MKTLTLYDRLLKKSSNKAAIIAELRIFKNKNAEKPKTRK